MRTCGSCDACCIAPEIVALNKPAGVPCAHLCKSKTGSCTIYKKRPGECSEFTCAWLTSPHMPKKFRPDRCGIMLVGKPSGIMQVWELKQRIEGSELAAWLEPRLGDWKLSKVF